MTEQEKVRIKPLESSDDYRLWRIRIEAACDAKGLDDVLTRERNPHADPEKKAKFETDKKKASGIIVTALSNEPLRIVRAEIGKPYSMIKKLNERYDSKSAASRIAKMTELVSLRYDSMKRDIGDHIDKMAGLVEQLSGMQTEIPKELAIALLIASIHVPEMAPITAAVKTLPDDSATWETVTARLIEEHQSLRSRRKAERASTAVKHCEICERNHFTKDCWLNPKNPKNKLQLANRNRTMFTSSDKKQVKRTAESEKKTRYEKPKPPRTRVAIAREFNATEKKTDVMMLDSGTTSHMTPHKEKVENVEPCSVSIALGDDSTVRADEKGTCPVVWNGHDGLTAVNLSGTLIAEDLAMSLLSVPALTSKGMAVLFLEDKALIIDIEDGMRVIGIAPRGADNLYCITTNGSETAPTFDDPIDKAMMALTRRFVDEEANRMISSDSDNEENDPDMPELLSSDEYSDSDESISEDIDRDDSETLHDDADSSYDSVDENHDDNNQLGEPLSNESHNGMELEDHQDGPVEPISDTIALWHERLGHQGSKKDIQDMIDEGILPDIKARSEGCDPCVKGKFKRQFRGSLTKENAPGRIHADLIGKIRPSSPEGHNYLLTIIDEATRYVEVFPLRRKIDASQTLIRFMNKFERQTGHRLRGLHTDGGSEFYKAREKFEELGVRVTASTPYTPSSNGLVERTQGTLLSLARACLVQAKLPLTYWVDAVLHVIQGRNLIKHSVTGKIPHVAMFNVQPEYAKHLRPFGCRVLASPNVKKTGKFESKLVEGVNLGHVDGGMYKILSDSKTFVTKHVRMFETQFPGLSLSEPNEKRTEGVDTVTTFGTTGYDSDSTFENVDLETMNTSIDELANLDALTYIPEKPSSFGESDHSTGGPIEETEQSNVVKDTTLPECITTDDEPSMKEALSSSEADHWKMAIAEEFQTLKELNTWEKADGTPSNLKPLPSGIILRLKRDRDGKPARFKARLVARGNLQEEGHISSEEKYAPVACFDLVRILLALSMSFEWSKHQVEIKGAFLHATLPESNRIWLKLPTIDGVVDAVGSLVRLVKSLYGLKEAPKLWYQKLAERLGQIGFVRLISSECLFVLERGSKKVILLAYVDDLGLFGDEDLISFVKEELRKHFDVTDLKQTKFFLGVNIEDSGDVIRLLQSSLIQKILQDSGMATCKPTKTPLPISHCLYEARTPSTNEEKQVMMMVPYKNILVSLLFLSTRTRPDIAVAVSMLGKFASDPTPQHWTMMKHMLRYLKGTADYGLLYTNEAGINVEAWSDADWGLDQDKRRSRSGFLITVGKKPVLWTSKLQPSVALSTCEAEFYALSDCVRDVKWVRQLFNELGIPVGKPTTIYQDNLGTIHWTEQVQVLRRVKHVGLRYHYVRGSVQDLGVEVEYTSSAENMADCLTKSWLVLLLTIKENDYIVWRCFLERECQISRIRVSRTHRSKSYRRHAGDDSVSISNQQCRC